MSKSPSHLPRLFAEMKRRKVFRVIAVYGATAFVILQVADLAFPILGLPDWTLRLILVLTMLGFPVAVVLAWAFEQTPEGLVRTEDATESEIEEIVAAPASQRWPAGVLALAGVVLLFGGGWWFGQRSAEESRKPNLVVPEARATEFRTIAILPFENVGGVEEDRALAAGLYLELQAALAQVAELRVTSVRDYENTDTRQIGTEYGVDHVLLGAVRRSADDVRISVQLIDTQSDENLWFDQFDREVSPENLFAVQSEIVQQVAERLKADLSPEDRVRLSAGPISEDLAALNWYYRALEASWDVARGGNYRNVIDYATHAVELDPELVEAWSLLARFRSLYVGWGQVEATAALEAVETAERLAPGSVAALKARASYVARVLDEVESALALYQDLERRVPSDADVIREIGILQARLGKDEEAARALRRAVRLDPQNPALLNSLAGRLRRLGRYEAADRVFERALQVNPNDAAARAGKVYRTVDLRGPGAARSLAAELGLDPTVWEEGAALAYLAQLHGELDIAEDIFAQLPRDTLTLEEINRLVWRGLARHLAGGDPTAFGDSVLALDPSDLPASRAGVALIVEGLGHVLAGREVVGWSQIAAARKQAEDSEDRYFSADILSIAAMAYAQFERFDDMLSILEAHIELPGIQISAVELELHPRYNGIRDDRRFQDVIRRRITFEEQAAREAKAEGPWPY